MRLRFARRAGWVGICFALASLICTGSEAATHKHHWRVWHSRPAHVARSVHAARSWRWQPTRRVFQLTDPEKDAALILDGETGRALYARNADALRHPASLTKMMTLYLLFEQLKNGQMTLATPITLSEHAVSQAPVKLYARPGTTISVEDAIKAIVVLSANDVAVGIAEAIGGSESHFAELMTAKARSWGMSHTYFHNASGLPDNLQITTADDLGVLARHLAYDFPQYFHYFSTYSFAWHGATHFTHDNLIGRYDGADGIKTGYTGASGFNLVSSVVRNGAHIIGVVMGGTTARRRDTEMVRLLDDTFNAIGKNPQLVARASVPWQMLAENTPAKPVIAGFQLGPVTSTPPIITAAPPPAPSLRPSTLAKPGVEDEEAAESTPDPAYDPTPVTTKPVATAPKEKMYALAPPPKTAPPAPPKAAAQQPPVGKVVVASLEPATHPAPAPAAESTEPSTPVSVGPLPRPRPKPAVPALALNDDTSASTNAVGTNWTVQIGAFGNATLAQSQLADYARKSADVLAEAARIVSPLESPEGHTIFRARFGPFDESRARQVCQVLTQRGQTCFAAIASR
ncbi:MAG TPA: D-alanyl-D-alanine carboxypeptidase [Rhizomicrobium sp.]|nr:D-alanyl-D-alanine carboxypeptidase [Rhizomicrobium sp.]